MSALTAPLPRTTPAGPASDLLDGDRKACVEVWIRAPQLGRDHYFANHFSEDLSFFVSRGFTASLFPLCTHEGAIMDLRSTRMEAPTAPGRRCFKSGPPPRPGYGAKPDIRAGDKGGGAESAEAKQRREHQWSRKGATADRGAAEPRRCPSPPIRGSPGPGPSFAQ